MPCASRSGDATGWKARKKNALRKELLALRKRARAGVAGVYGDDSAEYQAVGGVRVSERKKPGRKPK